MASCCERRAARGAPRDEPEAQGWLASKNILAIPKPSTVAELLTAVQTQLQLIAKGGRPDASRRSLSRGRSPLTCPDCHGVLLTIADGEQTSSSEEQLWSAARSLEESRLLLTHLGDQFAEANQPILAAVYYQHANAATTQAELVRRALGLHATLSVERLRPRADAGRGACRRHARA